MMAKLYHVSYRPETRFNPAARKSVLCVSDEPSLIDTEKNQKVLKWASEEAWHYARAKKGRLGKVFTLCTCWSQTSQTRCPPPHEDRDCFCSCPSHRVCVKSAQLPDALLFLPNLLSILLCMLIKNGFNRRPAVFPSFPQQWGKIISTDQSGWYDHHHPSGGKKKTQLK